MSQKNNFSKLQKFYNKRNKNVNPSPECSLIKKASVCSVVMLVLVVRLTCWLFLMWSLCIWAWWEGELVEPPLLEPAELMEHMELFLLPRLEGEEGGVWNMTPPSADLMSLNTYRQ